MGSFVLVWAHSFNLSTLISSVVPNRICPLTSVTLGDGEADGDGVGVGVGVGDGDGDGDRDGDSADTTDDGDGDTVGNGDAFVVSSAHARFAKNWIPTPALRSQINARDAVLGNRLLVMVFG